MPSSILPATKIIGGSGILSGIGSVLGGIFGGGKSKSGGGLSGLGNFFNSLGGANTLIPAGTSLLSAILGSRGAEEAGQLGLDASRYATDAALLAQMQSIDAQREMFDLQRGFLQPYDEAGQSVLAQLAAAVGGGPGSGTGYEGIDLTNLDPSQLPGYDFILEQGLDQVQNSFAARGLGSSVPALRGGVQFAEDLASTYWQDLINADIAMRNADISERSFGIDSLLGLAQLGQASAAGTGAGAIQTGRGLADTNLSTGQTISNNLISGGNAQAGAAASQGAIWSNAINNIGNNFLLNRLLSGGG